MRSKTFKINSLESRRAFVATMLNTAKIRNRKNHTTIVCADGKVFSSNVPVFPSTLVSNQEPVHYRALDDAVHHYWGITDYLMLIGQDSLTIPWAE